MLTKATLTAQTLANVLTQSSDCVKLISTNGKILWMNPNGLCAMEIDDFCQIDGKDWSSLWPEAQRHFIDTSYRESVSNGGFRFLALCPTAKGSERWWDVSVTALTGPDNNLSGYLSISRDVTDAELAKQAIKVSAAEMRHRLKNSYSIISSLLLSHARGDDALEPFALEMGERIAALGRAQTLFEENEDECHLDALVPALTEPFTQPGCDLAYDIPSDILLGRNTADVIALAIGEFAVNSTKHGAFANGGGIRVSARKDDHVHLIWEENSGAAVTRTSREGGQGHRLIEKIAKIRRGRFGLEWQPSGLIATLSLPL
ncbi:MAG: PAS domain-containing protein [Sphingobium sp.]|nr:PAS domain-containing protein [Sphingobium sp.]MCP5399826.1 PAS domain-containing protein [Sphingomonas sp.]